MKFTIGEPINEPKIYNLYKFVISNMHGDADGTSYTELLLRKDQETLLSDLIKLCVWSNSKWPSREDIEEKYDEIKKKYEEQTGDYELLDEPIIDSDNTCDNQCLCRPSIHKLTWFDENGIELKVTWK